MAPISRSSIVVGKCLGGATVATLQGLILLALAGLVGVPYNPLLIFGCAVMIFLVAFSNHRLRPRAGSAGEDHPGGHAVGADAADAAHVPVRVAVPGRRQAAALADDRHPGHPISYAVAAMRTFVLHFIHTPAGAVSSFQGGLTWGSFVVPTWLDILVVLGCGLALLGVACAMFSKTE